MKPHATRLVTRFAASIALVLIGLAHALPLYIAFNVALKAKSDLSSRWLPPQSIEWGNFGLAIEKAKIFLAIGNSIMITIASIALIIALCATAAYPLARNHSRLNRVILRCILGVLMVPPLSMLVPLLKVLTQLGGISSYWGIVSVLATFQLPIGIFLYTKFIKMIPQELDEASLIDGCHRFAIFYRIIFPLLKPVTATTIILTGIAVWNDYQFSLFLLQSPKMKVVTLAVSSFFAQSSTNLGAAAASAMISVLPVTVLFLFLQRYFIKGMVDSAVKG